MAKPDQLRMPASRASQGPEKSLLCLTVCSIRALRARLIGLSGRIGRVFREIRVHVIPGLGAVDENVRLRPKPARVVECADPDADQVGPRRNSQKQHAAAFRTKGPGYLIAAVRSLDVELRFALGDAEARCRHPHGCRVGAAALALTVPAMAQQRKNR